MSRPQDGARLAPPRLHRDTLVAMQRVAERKREAGEVFVDVTVKQLLSMLAEVRYHRTTCRER